MLITHGFNHSNIIVIPTNIDSYFNLQIVADGGYSTEGDRISTEKVI